MDFAATERGTIMRHRFHSICPYFAMFPESFAKRWIEKCTQPGQTILDPFAGRGTAPFQAILMGRTAIASDINPVAFVLSGAKLDSPTKKSVVRRLNQLRAEYTPSDFMDEQQDLPAFFQRAFHQATLPQILFLRGALEWRNSRVDRFLAALVLGSLHGEMDKSSSYFSNQMPRTISTKPNYSLKFWEKFQLWPEPKDVFAILRQRIDYRFASAPPAIRGSAYLADVRDLPHTAQQHLSSIDCVITSPPYLNVTNFEEDQWLRLWFLGGDPHPNPGRHSRDDRHERPEMYWAFLCDAWRALRPLMKKQATLVCRIGGRGLSEDMLCTTFSASVQFLARKWKLVSYEVSYLSKRQTDAFRPGTVGCRFELDFCFELTQ
jgi:DNA methylase